MMLPIILWLDGYISDEIDKLNRLSTIRMDEVAINQMISSCFERRKRLRTGNSKVALFLISLTALHQGLRMLLSRQGRASKAPILRNA